MTILSFSLTISKEAREVLFFFTSNILAWSHFPGLFSPCPHLLKRDSFWDECVLIMWYIKALNFAQITWLSPLKVAAALQYRLFFAWLYPISQNLTDFLFRLLADHLLYLWKDSKTNSYYLQKKKKKKKAPWASIKLLLKWGCNGCPTLFMNNVTGQDRLPVESHANWKWST